MVDFFCYREKESSDEGTQESIKVREKNTKKLAFYLLAMMKMTVREVQVTTAFSLAIISFVNGTCKSAGSTF